MVPSGWKKTTLDNVLTIGGGKDYKHLAKGDIPVYGSGGYMLGVSDYLYDGESVCIGRKGTIDKPIFLTGKFWTVDTLFYTHSFEGSEPYYIYQFFQTVQWRRLNEASGVPSLSKSIINKISINPPPLPEQRKIAKILSTWDKAISTTERLIDNSKQQKKALMQQLLTGKKRLLDDSGRPFEGEWDVVHQGDVATFHNGRAYKKTEWEEKGTPVIRLQNLTGRGTEFYYSTLELPEHQYCTKDDLLYMWSATFGPAIWKGEKAIYHYHIWKVACKPNQLSKLFMFYMLDYETQKWMSQSNGMGLLHITKTTMEKQLIGLPPIVEQQKIASVLIAADKEIDFLEQQLSNLKQEKKALMQQLLTGKRRVKLDDTAAA